MTAAQAARRTLVEAAQLLDFQWLDYADSDAWRLVADGGTAFDVEHDEGSGRLVIQSDIGTVSDAACTRVYEILLQYNYLWSQTGGIRMALDGPAGQVVMMFDVQTADLEVSALCGMLTRMSRLQKAWREILKDAVGAGNDTTASLRWGSAVSGRQTG